MVRERLRRARNERGQCPGKYIVSMGGSGGTHARRPARKKTISFNVNAPAAPEVFPWPCSHYCGLVTEALLGPNRYPVGLGEPPP